MQVRLDKVDFDAIADRKVDGFWNLKVNSRLIKLKRNNQK